MKIFMFAAVCLENGDVKFAILDYKVDGLQELINNNEKHTGREVEPLDGYEFPVDYKLYTFEEMKSILSEDLKALEYYQQNPNPDLSAGSPAAVSVLNGTAKKLSVIMQVVYSVSCAVIVVIVTAAVVFIFRKNQNRLKKFRNVLLIQINY